MQLLPRLHCGFKPFAMQMVVCDHVGSIIPHWCPFLLGSNIRWSPTSHQFGNLWALLNRSLLKRNVFLDRVKYLVWDCWNFNLGGFSLPWSPILAFKTSTKVHFINSNNNNYWCHMLCIFTVIAHYLSWYLCFSLASSVKTWFLRLVSTWGRSQRAMSPSRLVLHMILLKF